MPTTVVPSTTPVEPEPSRAAASDAVAISRAGHRGPAQLLEHDGGLGPAEPDAAGVLGDGQAEHAHRAQLGPQAAVDRTRLRGRGPAGVVVDPGGEEAAQLVAQRGLVVGRLEVHQRSLGQAEHALADDVALDLRGARGDRQRQRVEPALDVVGARQTGRVAHGQPGPAEHLHGEVAHAHLGVVVGELEDRAADAGVAEAGRPGHVALGHRPLRLELGRDDRQLPLHVRRRPTPRSCGRPRRGRPTRRNEPSSSLTNAVPRSKLNVTMATRQPSFSSPTRFSTGMRTSSRNISLKSLAPASVFIGRMSMPGVSIGMTIQLMPRCLGALGVGADQQLAVVGDLRVRRPDLLAGDDVVVAVAHRLRAQRREVRAGARLGEALAPHVVAPEDAGQVLRLLLGVASAPIVGPAWSVPTKLHPTYGAPARSVSSRKMSCSVGDAPRPPYSFGQAMPAYPAS